MNEEQIQEKIQEQIQEQIQELDREPEPEPHSPSSPTKPPPSETEIKLINKGSYGCIYRPEITCDGHIGNSMYVSKIQENSSFIEKEKKLGSLIQEKIPHYLQYFAPIIKTCYVSLSPISEEEQAKCDVLKKETDTNSIAAATTTATPATTADATSDATSDATAASATTADATATPSDKDQTYISSKIRYVGNKNIYDYLESLPNDESIFVKKIQSTYLYLLQSLKKLKEIGIIHYDIKADNILYDEKNHSPIIIDFGISFIGSSVNPENRQYVFYTKEFYPVWCIDIFLLSYIVQTKMNPTTQITAEDFSQLFEHFYTELNKLIPILPEEHQSILKNFENTFQPFIGKTWESLYEYLYTPNIYETWDHYSLCVTFLMMLHEINKTSHFHFIKNAAIQQYIKLWKSVVYAMPNARVSLEKTMEEEFMKI